MTVALGEGLILEDLTVEGYERVLKITHEKIGLKALISIHDTRLGPALGGTRIFPYGSWDEALGDVLRLSKGMTYKSAIAQVGLGGGKSVIMADPRTQKSEELLLAFAEAVEKLSGLYICAEDVGCNAADTLVMRRATSYIVGLPHEKSSGDPSPFTAWGTLRGIHSVLERMRGKTDLKGIRVAIQGLGSVGSRLAELLFQEGAELILADIDPEKTAQFAHLYGAKTCTPTEIFQVECDVLAPCALGGVINSKTIPTLRCSAIAGCANNQLLEAADGEELKRRGILYAPDFVINAGGLINVANELEPQGYDAGASQKKVDAIYEQLLTIYDLAEERGISTEAAALALGDQILDAGTGKRKTPLYFHHADKSLSL